MKVHIIKVNKKAIRGFCFGLAVGGLAAAGVQHIRNNLGVQSTEQSIEVSWGLPAEQEVLNHPVPLPDFQLSKNIGQKFWDERSK